MNCKFYKKFILINIDNLKNIILTLFFLVIAAKKGTYGHGETQYKKSPYETDQILCSLSKVEKFILEQLLNADVVSMLIIQGMGALIILLFAKLLSNEKLIIINSFWTFLSIISLIYCFSKVLWNHETILIKVYDFLNICDFNITLEFAFDQITFLMLFIVIIISSLVIQFSYWYMKGDPNFSKFVCFINFFSFFMLVLVAANNLILIFVGWEGIGIFSYLLINFWATRLNANRSALKALVLNKVGDCFFYIFIFLYFFTFETFNLYDAKLLVSAYFNDSGIIFLNETINNLVFFLIIACMAKSAQVILHVWLPDAMEGPTPVSALLHAATMVTAGIYVLIKFNWLIFYDESIYVFIIFIGILTNLIASFTAIFQFDIKKIIAYSTASQLGLIFIAYGTLKFNLAMFHIFNHAFFKALLFILAGVLIHKLYNNQDLRNMFFFKNNIFLIYAIFLIASLTLIGFPFLSAFYSKDLIIQNAFINIVINKDLAIFFLKMSVITTIMYSFKVLYYLFIKPNINTFTNILIYNKKNMLLIQDFCLIFSIYILTIFSIFVGYLMSTYFLTDFLTLSSNLINNLYIENLSVAEFLETSCAIIFELMVVGASLSFWEMFFIRHQFFYSSTHLNMFFFLNKKTLFDAINYYISMFLLINFNFIFVLYDKFMIERIIILVVNKKNNFIRKMKNLYANLKWWFYVMVIVQVLIDILAIIFVPRFVFIGAIFFTFSYFALRMDYLVDKLFKK